MQATNMFSDSIWSRIVKAEQWTLKSPAKADKGIFISYYFMLLQLQLTDKWGDNEQGDRLCCICIPSCLPHSPLIFDNFFPLFHETPSMANYFPFVHSLPLKFAVTADFTSFEDYSLYFSCICMPLQLRKGTNKEQGKVAWREEKHIPMTRYHLVSGVNISSSHDLNKL